MKKKYKIILSLVILFILVGYKIYDNNFSNQGIYHHVISFKGYNVKLIKNPVTITGFIKPEWITLNKGEKKKFNIVVGKFYDTAIHLENVFDRGDYIFFTFNAVPKMSYHDGKLLYIDKLNKNGTFSTNLTSYKLYNINNEKIIDQLYGSGSGPGNRFLITVSVRDIDLIKKGFNFKYKGYILYEYSKK